MKTNKSLLVKFLTVLCALCFSLSLVFGLVGCGEETVSIVGSSINENGQLVLTYSDGTSKTYDVIGKNGVDGEDGKDATVCAHTNKEIVSVDDEGDVIYMSLGGKYADYCGFATAICLDCNHAFVVMSEHDTEEVKAKEATCYAEGHTAGLQCKNCSYMVSGESVAKKEHSKKEYAVAYDASTGLNPCEDGVILVTICETCKAGGAYEDADLTNEFKVTYTYTAGLGHKSNNWKEDVDPTLTTPGSLKADSCTACGNANVTMDIPALTDAKYVKTQTKVKDHCEDTEKFNYELKVGEQKFNYEIETEAGKHLIAEGVEYVAGKVYAYDEALFTKFNNVTETCAASGFDVFFNCATCEKPIQTKAKIAHKTVFEVADNPATETVEEPTISKKPSCLTVGYYSDYTCPVCSTEIKYSEDNTLGFNALLEVEATGHEYVYGIASTNANGTVNLLGKCKNNCGIDHPINNATATYAKTDSTCTAEGEESWTVTEINGEELEEALVAKNEIGKKAHKLGEEDMNLTEVYDWTVYEAKGLIGFNNVSKTCEDGGFDVFFYCATCEKPITVKAEVPHTEPVDPNPETEANENIYITEATCEQAGEIKYNCKVCGDEVKKHITKLDHSYTYTMTADDTYAYIEGVCVHGAKHTIDSPAKTVSHKVALADLTYVDKVDATCVVDGIRTYSWTPTGSTTPLTVDVNIGKTEHKLNGDYIDDEIVHYIGNGIQPMGNSTPACDSTTPGQGMFTCEHCNKPISVQVKQPHTKPETGVVTEEATCEKAGSVKYQCTVCKENVNDPITQLQHVVSYKMNTLVEPTDTQPGSIKVGCATCTTKDDEIEIPALSDAVLKSEAAVGATYTYEVVTEDTCSAEGVIKYSYKHATYGVVEFNIVVDDEGHNANEPPFTWIHDGYVYTGKICSDCGKVIVLSYVAVQA
ncbi:MAG: hypothetical protein J6Q38_05775 [Clostridia bacterium]|nr:hypothetical protein [Clostridia bacterium]